jgi:phospholipid/cholesterol/gamma-HCH transport system permease protein
MTRRNNVVARIGGAVLGHVDYVGGLACQFGSSVAALRRTLPLVGLHDRWRSAVLQMLAVGVDAAPMVGIMALCSGFILAMQGATELRRFGALEYVVNLVTIAFTREMGPLLTAIAVSGRSGSAFSAEIGSMVVTEEMDALRTMAIDPVEFVLAPKYLAALIVIPCLSIVCSACGISAGAVFLRFTADMTFGVYLRAVVQSIVLRDVTMGLVKSLAFATIIVQVGCLEGFRVRGGPDAVGRSATAAVVKSTFLVILADVAFTAVFYVTGGG